LRQILIGELLGNADVCWWQSSGWFWKFLGVPSEAPRVCVAVPLKHGPPRRLAECEAWKGAETARTQLVQCFKFAMDAEMQELWMEVQNLASPLPFCVFSMPEYLEAQDQPPPPVGIACPHEVASPHRTLVSRAPAGHLRLHLLPSLGTNKLQGAVATGRVVMTPSLTMAPAGPAACCLRTMGMQW
jgi:hypothetical protein